MNVFTVSAKIPQHWIQLITAKGKPSAIVRLALAQYLGLSEEPEVYREGLLPVSPLRSELDSLRSRLTAIEKLIHPSATRAQPIADDQDATNTDTKNTDGDTISPDTVSPADGDTVSPADGTISPDTKNDDTDTISPFSADTKTDDTDTISPADAISPAEPIAVPPAVWHTTTQAHKRLQAIGCTKTLQSFRRDLQPCYSSHKLPADLIGLGLRADFQARESYESISKINKAAWLRFEPIEGVV